MRHFWFIFFLFSHFSYSQMLTVEIENDLIAKTDRDYTHGTKISYRHYLEEDKNYRYLDNSIFQFIYTPEDIEETELQPKDRPWAGMLGYELWLIEGNSKFFNGYGFQVGTIGPNSFAQESQKKVHRITDSTEPLGWDNQLGESYFATGMYKFGYRYLDYKYFDLSQSANIFIGTTLANVGTGLTARLGFNLSDGFLSSAMEPATRKWEDNINHIKNIHSFYIFSGTNFRYVPYNGLITGGESELTLKNFVNDYYVGMGISYSNIDLLYQYTLRGREYKEDETFHAFGKLSVSYRF